MYSFRNALRKGTTSEIFDSQRVHCLLAEACLSQLDNPNVYKGKALYCCLSHLAQVPVLEINLNAYDSLIFEDMPDKFEEIKSLAEIKTYELEVRLCRA